MITPTNPQFDQMVNAKSNDELLSMLATPQDWQPALLDAAKLQLEQRGIEFDKAQDISGDPEFDEMQQLSEYRVFRKDLRTRGAASIGWGILNIVLGLSFMDENQLNVGLAVIGGLLVIEGIWVLFSPQPVGMILDAFGLFILGVWNIVVSLAGNTDTPIFWVLGAMQIGWGYQSFAKYKRFAHVAATEVSADIPQKLNRLGDFMKEASMAGDSSVIEFVTSGPNLRWKGQLRKTGAVFVAQPGHKPGRDVKNARLLFAPKPDVSCTKTNDGLSNDTVKVAFSFKGRKHHGLMSREAFQRFETWKIGIKNQAIPA